MAKTVFGMPGIGAVPPKAQEEKSDAAIPQPVNPTTKRGTPAMSEKNPPLVVPHANPQVTPPKTAAASKSKTMFGIPMVSFADGKVTATHSPQQPGQSLDSSLVPTEPPTSTVAFANQDTLADEMPAVAPGKTVPSPVQQPVAMGRAGSTRQSARLGVEQARGGIPAWAWIAGLGTIAVLSALLWMLRTR